MSFENKIQESLKAAMRNKDQAALRALRALKSAILIAKTEKAGVTEIAEDDGIKIIQKLVKQRSESIEIYKQQGREELASDEIAEVEILETFLPKQLSAKEVEVLVKAIIEKTGAQTRADMGKVMGMAMKEAAGRTDGKTISSAAAKLLS